MPSNSVNLELAQIALERSTGSLFEKFINAFYPSIAGENFIPLGGNKDGGADAFQSEGLVLGSATSVFYQSSTEVDYRSKIAQTVKRLREIGRDPSMLVYITSRVIPFIDLEEAELSRKLGLGIKIRDRAFIIAHVNDGPGTVAAFNTYLLPTLDYLKSIGASPLLTPSKNVDSPAIYAFLRQELDRYQGNENLVNALADGLILWALEETDPDKEILMSEQEIRKKIAQALPSAEKTLRGVIPHRLQKLSERSKAYGRAIRRYKKKGMYCLSYEFRLRIAEDNASDSALKIQVQNAFLRRIVKSGGETLDGELQQAAVEISLNVIQRTYEKEGIEFSAFLNNQKKEGPSPVITDYIDECLNEAKLTAEDWLKMKEIVLANLQGAFYNSDESERLFFSKLSITYTLLFCLNTEPRVVEYFQNMASDFYLYVGSDLIIRALSERYLRETDQVTRNAFKIIREAGGKLVLSEAVLEEVLSHIQAADYEFVNHYARVENSITDYMARNSDRILIRAYFYARRTPPEGIQGPKDWHQFMHQFCDYSELHKTESREQLKRYLMAQFGMSFESRAELEKLSIDFEVSELAEQLLSYKNNEMLARNDALMALGIYGRRSKRGEGSSISEFGYRTWWLTGETKILKYTKDLETQKGARYIMRPDFLVRFLSLAPSASEVRRTYRSIFPSILGIKLARRVDSQELKKVLAKLEEAQELEPGRRQAKISELADQLKTVFLHKPIVE